MAAMAPETDRGKRARNKQLGLRITIRIDEATERGLAAIAFREGRTIADVIRRMARMGLDAYTPEARRPLPPTSRALAALEAAPAAPEEKEGEKEGEKEDRADDPAPAAG